MGILLYQFKVVIILWRPKCVVGNIGNNPKSGCIEGVFNDMIDPMT